MNEWRCCFCGDPIGREGKCFYEADSERPEDVRPMKQWLAHTGCAEGRGRPETPHPLSVPRRIHASPPGHPVQWNPLNLP